MPTVVTHAIVGAALGSAGPAAASRRRLALVLALLAMLPDADVLAFAFGVPYAAPLGHRGFSHSLLFALVAGLVAAALAFRELPWRDASWRRVAALAVLATASHGFLDAFTDAGLGIGFLLPFDDTRTFFPWRPLATSPIGFAGFFANGGAGVLASELCWIVFPCAALLLAARARRA